MPIPADALYVYEILTDEEVRQDPFVQLVLESWTSGACTYERALLAAIRGLVGQKNILLAKLSFLQKEVDRAKGL